MSSTPNVIQITSEDRLMDTPPFLAGPAKKACPVSFFNCQDKSPEHINAYIHACPYGQSCRDFNDSYHASICYHYKNPRCNGTDCELTDPYHRRNYHHPGCPDYLISCRYNGECKEIHNKAHTLRYHHFGIDIYPEIPKELK